LTGTLGLSVVISTVIFGRPVNPPLPPPGLVNQLANASPPPQLTTSKVSSNNPNTPFNLPINDRMA
jgi:hypothetical protein